MKKFALGLTTVIVFLILQLTSCSTSFDEMIENYNSQFKKGYATITDTREEEEKIYSPGDPEFVPADMLFNEYFVYDDGMLILSAPPKCGTIKWEITDPSNNYSKVMYVARLNVSLNDRVTYYRGIEYDGQTLIMYMPESNLLTNDAVNYTKVYKLTLTVTDIGGSEYRDSCGIVIYQHYNR